MLTLIPFHTVASILILSLCMSSKGSMENLCSFPEKHFSQLILTLTITQAFKYTKAYPREFNLLQPQKLNKYSM